jgi:hypothetical protein
MDMPSPNNIVIYMERLDNLTKSLQKNTEILEASIQANNQRHEENEARIEKLEEFNLMWTSRLEGGRVTVKIAATFAFLVLMFAVKGFYAGLVSLLESFKGG